MKKKIIAGASIVTLAGILAAASVMTGFIGKADAPSAAQVRVTALQKGDLAVSTNANGMVYSTSVTQVSSNLNYSVKSVYVSVGDRVKEGDVLAEVDTSELESSIEQKKASLSSSQASAQLNLAEAQNNLAIYQRNLEGGYDSNLINAESSITSAEKSVADAEVSVSTAELDLSTANTELRTARDNYRDAYNGQGDYEDGATDSQLQSLRNAVSSRENSVEKAQYSLENAKRNLESAKQNLEKSQTNYEAAKLGSSDSIANYQNGIKKAQLSSNFSEQQLSLEKLEGDLEKAVLTSPVTGTVTSVEAVVGGSSSDLLFIIQDTDYLKIVTNVQEYDIGTVAVGNKVIITTEATGDLEFEGTLTKIAPTSTLTTKGNTASSTTAEYEAEVTVSASAPKGLLVGMNALLSIVTQEKKNVYYVPYEAVAKIDRQSVVYVVRRQEDGASVAEAVNVTTGLENEIYIEISGDSLTEDMRIISDASGITQGASVEVQDNAARGRAAGENPSGAQQQGGFQMGIPGIGGAGGRAPAGGGGARG